MWTVSEDSGSVFHESWLRRGMAIADIDNDGRLDAVVTTNDCPILHNETASPNHWLTLKLVGHKSNRDAIGAEVEAWEESTLRRTNGNVKRLRTVISLGFATEYGRRF